MEYGDLLSGNSFRFIRSEHLQTTQIRANVEIYIRSSGNSFILDALCHCNSGILISASLKPGIFRHKHYKIRHSATGRYTPSQTSLSSSRAVSTSTNFQRLDPGQSIAQRRSTPANRHFSEIWVNALARLTVRPSSPSVLYASDDWWGIARATNNCPGQFHCSTLSASMNSLISSKLIMSLTLTSPRIEAASIRGRVFL